MNSSELLRLEGFSVIRGDVPLFAPVTLSLNEGEALHLLAANGVGKTTMLRALYGMSAETIGTIHWQGQQVHKLADKCSYINDRNGSIAHLSVSEALEKMMIFAGIGTEKTHRQEILSQFGLRQPEQMFSELSKGQKKRFHLARVALSAKKLWLLDEPFDGLDSEGRQLLIGLMDEQINKGGAILYTSHISGTEIQYSSKKSLSLKALDERRGQADERIA